MANNYNGVPRPPVVFCRDGDARVVVRRETYDDLARAPRCLSPSASACSATAPSAARSPSCSPSAPTTIERVTGLRPEITRRADAARAATSTRSSSGSRPDRRADRRHRARARLRAAGDARRASTSSPPTSSCSPSTARSCGRPRASTACSCASRPRSPASCRSIRVLQESLAGAHVERVHGIVNGTTNFILTEMAAHRRELRRGAGRGPAPRLRRGRPDRRRHRPRRRGEDGDPRAAGVRHAGAPRRGPLRGHRAHHRRRPRVRARARPRPEADRHRRARRRRPVASACTRRSSTAATRWPRSTGRSTRSRSSPPAITEITHVAAPAPAGRRRPARCSATSISAMIPPASTPPTGRARCEIVRRRRVGLLPAPGGRRPARRAGRRSPQVLGRAGRLDQVGRAEGAGRERAPGDGHAPAARVALLRGARADRRARLRARRARARSASSRRSSC